MDDWGVWGIVILILWLVLSNVMGGGRTKSSSDNKHYPIERRKPEPLATREPQGGGRWTEITAQNAKLEDASRKGKQKTPLLERKAVSLFDQIGIEEVQGVVMDDPQLPSGSPQLNARNPQRERLLPSSKKLLKG